MLIRTRRPAPRVLDLEDDRSTFATVVFQADSLRRNSRRPELRAKPQEIRVIMQVSDDGERWEDWGEPFWSGPFRPDAPLPTKEELLDAARRAGARYAKSVIRSTI